MPADASATVERLLRKRADRGVFRSFSAEDVRGGKRRFLIVWLHESPLTLTFDPKTATLEFRDLLPNVPARGAMDRELRRFLSSRTDEALPAHRRIDPRKAEVSCRNRKGAVSVALRSLDGDLDYATGKALKLVNEIFLGFLRGPYFEYMAANFHEPEE